MYTNTQLKCLHFYHYKNNDYDGYYFKPSILIHSVLIGKANIIIIDENLYSSIKEEYLNKWKWI